ncbi:MAG: DUF1684 domain-containing protein [Methanobacteriota archaeon]
MDVSAYVAHIERYRAARNRYFREDPSSPVRPEARATFPGIPFFPIDTAWRIDARLVPLSPEPLLRVPATEGDVREWRDLGTVTFDAPTGRGTLHVYRPLGEDWDDPFVMFRDETSGRETYGGGRYLEPEETAPGRFVLDFNTCYSPFCAYDDSWSCTIPPPENRLAFPVRAGERAPPSP